jgi:hypothetical protein
MSGENGNAFEGYFDAREHPPQIITPQQLIDTYTAWNQSCKTNSAVGMSNPSFEDVLRNLPDIGETDDEIRFALALSDYEVAEEGEKPLIVIGWEMSIVLSKLFNVGIPFPLEKKPAYAHLSIGNEKGKCYIIKSTNISFESGKFFGISPALQNMIGDKEAIITEITRPLPPNTDTLIDPDWKI